MEPSHLQHLVAQQQNYASGQGDGGVGDNYSGVPSSAQSESELSREPGKDYSVRASFTTANRLRRVLWHIVYVLLFRPTPRPMHAWRSAILRIFGAKIGKHVHVYPKVKIWAPWNLVIEDYVGVGSETNLYSMATIHLKERCIISQGAHLCAGTHDYEDPEFPLYALPITVGVKAWVCTEAFVGPGVTIGDGAVIGARAVATKDMPEWTVCAGNPCKPLKPRVIREPLS